MIMRCRFLSRFQTNWSVFVNVCVWELNFHVMEFLVFFLLLFKGPSDNSHIRGCIKVPGLLRVMPKVIWGPTHPSLNHVFWH